MPLVANAVENKLGHRPQFKKKKKMYIILWQDCGSARSINLIQKKKAISAKHGYGILEI